VPTIGGIEGRGRAILAKGAGRLPHFIGSLTVAIDDWRGVVELQMAGDPTKYIGPALTNEGAKSVTLNALITKVHTPSAVGTRVDFISTGPPLNED
jgi:hypothetical protein